MKCTFGSLRPLVAALLLGVAAAATTGCDDGGGAQRGTGQGKVVAVDLAAGEITLDHGAIPGVMGAMQMAFPVSDPELLEGVSPGQTVEFDVEYQGGMYTVRAIRPAGP